MIRPAAGSRRRPPLLCRLIGHKYRASEGLGLIGGVQCIRKGCGVRPGLDGRALPPYPRAFEPRRDDEHEPHVHLLDQLLHPPGNIKPCGRRPFGAAQ